ncbi:spore gernimation protein GerPD [Oceanobacillus senegalensis]|uniref:spore gernimation protein GerPD n=1 Tax=Oceanobacillus senegalensis TaxID=1936063 RepID=UPI000A3051BE|nr:spore gernimation protein GerPD [Oceanobacillus senegalensis]
MIMEVHNWGLCVEKVEIDSVGASSVFLIGDNESIVLSSFFDTPPESYKVGNLVPLFGITTR